MIIGSPKNLSHENYIPDTKILGKNVERVHEFDQLGVTVDDKLHWSRHIEKLYRKLSSSLVTIYRSLVESRLRYCNVVWENCGSPLIEKLQCLQNRAIQLISKESESSDLNKLFTDLSILNIQQLIDFNTTNMVYDSVNRNCPKYLTDIFIPAQRIHNYSTRHANHGLSHPIQIWLQVNGHSSLGDVTCGIHFPNKSSVQQYHRTSKKACSNTPSNKIKF